MALQNRVSPLSSSLSQLALTRHSFKQWLMDQFMAGNLPPGGGSTDFVARGSGGDAPLAAMHGLATASIGNVEGQARQRIQADAAADTREALTGLAGRGLGNAGVGASVRRGIDADTGRSLGDLSERMAVLKTNLAMQQAGQQAQQQRADWNLQFGEQQTRNRQYADMLRAIGGIV